MGNAGSKVCETEKFEQHQQSAGTLSRKRPRSLASDQPACDCKRPRLDGSDDNIELVRRDLERRFATLRAQPISQAVSSSGDAHLQVIADDSIAKAVSHSGEHPSSPASSTLLGQEETAAGDESCKPAQASAKSDCAPSPATSCINVDDLDMSDATLRSPSPELLTGSVDQVDATGWSIRHKNTELKKLASTLLFTDGFPDYAKAFGASGKLNEQKSSITPDQRKRNVRGIKLANMALRTRDLDLEASDELPATKLLSKRGNRAYPRLQLASFEKVANAFEHSGILRHQQAVLVMSAGYQRELDGVWRSDGWQSTLRDSTITARSGGVKKDWAENWEPLRSQRTNKANQL